MRESEIEKRLKTGVEAKGGLCWKWTSPGLRGVPDRIVIMPGARRYFVELKAAGGFLSPHQKRRHNDLLNRGVVVYTLCSPEQVDDFLKEL